MMNTRASLCPRGDLSKAKSSDSALSSHQDNTTVVKMMSVIWSTSCTRRKFEGGNTTRVVNENRSTVTTSTVSETQVSNQLSRFMDHGLRGHHGDGLPTKNPGLRLGS